MRFLIVFLILVSVSIPAHSQSRIRLLADTTVWFDANKLDDSGDGLTPATAKKNPQAMWDWALDNYDFAGHKLRVASVGPRAYYNTGLLTSRCAVGQANSTDLIFDGDGSGGGGRSGISLNDPAINGTDREYAIATGRITTGENAVCTRFMVQNWQFAGSVGGAINANGGVIIGGPNLLFGGMPHSHLDARGAGAEILMLNSYSIVGPASTHASEMTGAMIYIANGVTVAISGEPTFSYGFAVAQWGGWIYIAKRPGTTGVNFVGTAHGRKYVAQYNFAGIDTQTQDEDYLPGDQPGCRAQGQYAHKISDFNAATDATGTHC